MEEKHPIDLFPSSWFDYTPAKVPLSIAHSNKADIGEDLLDVFVTVMHRDPVECMQY